MQADIVKPKRNILFLLLDIFLLAGFVAVNQVHQTGIVFHEWFGVFLGLTLLLHLVLHWRWILNVVKKFFRIKNLSQQLKLVVDALILVGFATIMITGILMSKSFLPAFGITGVHSFTLKMLHKTSTSLTIYLVGAHLLLNAKWILKTIAGLFNRSVKPSEKKMVQA
jgi:hypothetical protein